MDRTLIIYSKECMACNNRKRWREILKFCRDNNLGVKEVRTSYDIETKHEAITIANKHKTNRDFILLNERAININDNLDDLL